MGIAQPFACVPVLYSIDQSVTLVGAMRESQASGAKTHLPSLQHEVERGETVIITRHGRAIARIVPIDAVRCGRIGCFLPGLRS